MNKFYLKPELKSIPLPVFPPLPQIHGTMRVILEPLIGDMPLIGALSLFFLRKPVSTFISVSTLFRVLMTVVRKRWSKNEAAKGKNLGNCYHLVELSQKNSGQIL